MWGGLLSRESHKDAEAETVDTVEGNMCGSAIARSRRSAVVEDPITCKGSMPEAERSRARPGGLRRAGPPWEGEEP